MDSPPEPQREHTLTVGLVISETVRLSLCVVLSLEVCDTLLQQQKETHVGRYRKNNGNTVFCGLFIYSMLKAAGAGVPTAGVPTAGI